MQTSTGMNGAIRDGPNQYGIAQHERQRQGRQEYDDVTCQQNQPAAVPQSIDWTHMGFGMRLAR